LWLALAIAVAVVVAAALSAYQLTSRSLWLDEGATISIASQHGSALWLAIRHDGGNMLIYYLLVHVLIGWFGSGEAVVRIPSVVATAAAAGLSAGLGWRLVRRVPVALGSGLLTAVSLPLVFWGQDARGYALLVALALGGLLAFVVIVQSPERVPRTAVVAYFLLTILSFYVSFYAGLLVLVELAVLPWFRHRARLIIGCLVVIAAVCVPLAVLALQRGSGQLFWVNYPTLGIVAKMGAALISSGLPPTFHVTTRTIVASAVTVAAGLLLLGWHLVAARRTTAAPPPALARAGAEDSGGSAPPGSLLLAAAWLLVPTVVMLVAAFAGEPVELQRGIILVIPAVGLLLSWGLLGRGVSPLIGAGGLIVLLAVRVLVLAPTYGSSPENWRAATEHVARAGHPGDCVLFYPQDGRMPFDYYLGRAAAAASLRPVLPTTPWNVVRPYVEDYAVPSTSRLARIERGCPRLWVLASHQGHKPGPLASRRDLIRYHRLLADLHGAYRHRSHRQFGYAAPIYVTRFWR
jgi:mannosyltransferase